MEIRVDGNTVKRLREARLWTQEELAERCRVHARTVQRVEAQGVASSATLKAIAVGLEVDPSALTLADAGTPTNGNEPRLELPWVGMAAAFLWVALACLVHVPTAGQGLTSAAISVLGFACFALGLYCIDRRRTNGLTRAEQR
jgi:transcriptional regulator with XRE-family HTH domain